jgi:hypothetical protein
MRLNMTLFLLWDRRNETSNVIDRIDTKHSKEKLRSTKSSRKRKGNKVFIKTEEATNS